MAGDELEYRRGAGLGPLDKIMLRGASNKLSLEEISALVGGAFTPEQCYARLQDLRKKRNWQDNLELQEYILDDLLAVKDMLLAKALDAKSIEAAKPLIPLLQGLDKSLSAQKVDLESAMKEISRGHSKIMLAGIGAALDAALKLLQQQHPEITEVELLSAFNDAMTDAVPEIEAKVAGD